MFMDILKRKKLVKGKLLFAIHAEEIFLMYFFLFVSCLLKEDNATELYFLYPSFSFSLLEHPRQLILSCVSLLKLNVSLMFPGFSYDDDGRTQCELNARLDSIYIYDSASFF